MTFRFARRAAIALAMAAGIARLAAAPQQAGPPPATGQQPVFRSSVDLVRVDVQVVNKDGHPMVDLGIADFDVALDGRPRRVVSAELVTFEHPDEDELGLPIRTPGVIPEDSRLFIIAVDQIGLSPGGIMPMREAARRFLAQLRPQDMVGLYEFPFKRTLLDITHDHRSVGRALDQVIGMRETQIGVFNLSPSEIVEINAEDPDTFRRVIDRECDPGDPTCPPMVRAEASSIAGYIEAETTQRLTGLSTLMKSLSFIPGRKTVVLLSGGLMGSSRVGGRPDVRHLMTSVGEETANAQTNLYLLHFDTSFLDAYSAFAQVSRRRPSDRFENLNADRDVMSQGLYWLAGKAGGAVLQVEAGSGDFAFSRVLRETSSYYLLGIEPTDEDRDGKSHFIRVDVRPKGAVVRSRIQVFIPKAK